MLRKVLLAGLAAAGLGICVSTADACPGGGFYGGPGYSSGYFGGPSYGYSGFRSAGYRGGTNFSIGYSNFGGYRGYPGYGYGYPAYGRGYGYGGPGFYGGPRSGFSIGFSSGRGGWGW